MDEVSLPRACVAKAAKDLAPDGLSVSKDTCDLLVGCCTEFINLVASEASTVAKSVVKPEHIVHALGALEFESYVPIAKRAAEETGKAPKKRKVKRAESGLSAEELVAEQNRLIASAREWSAKQGAAAAPDA
jgi:histone H3/H4